MSLEDRTAVVTGGSRGIGGAIAERLAAGGARVAVFDTHREWGEELERLGREGRLLYYAADVTDRAATEASFEAAVGELGRLDILVNNAGISVPAPLESLPLESWDRVMSVNLRAVFTCSQLAFPFLEENGGCIVSISSMSGVEPYAGMGAYSASKAGVIMLTRQMAYEWAPYGIRANAICPGLIRSPLTEDLYRDPDVHEARVALVPAKRIGLPGDVAELAAFLVSDEASYITGQAIVADGGLLGSIQAHLRGRSRTR